MRCEMREKRNLVCTNLSIGRKAKPLIKLPLIGIISLNNCVIINV